MNKTITRERILAASSGILLITAIVFGANLYGQENVYACLDREIAQVCDSLSRVNSNGIQTRCYYTEQISRNETKQTYKTCRSGWVKFENTEIRNKTFQNRDLVCDDGELIKSCTDGETEILRVQY